MSEKFYCKKPGGVMKGDFGPKSLSQNENEMVLILEGTAEKGPWYNAFEFSDDQIQHYLANSWIEFCDQTASGGE